MKNMVMRTKQRITQLRKSIKELENVKGSSLSKEYGRQLFECNLMIAVEDERVKNISVINQDSSDFYGGGI